MRTLVAYVPVLHEGYRRFFEKHKGEKELYLFGPEITIKFPWLAKEIRQLDAKEMQKAIRALGIFKRVLILDTKSAQKLNAKKQRVILPSEDVSRELAQKYFPLAKASFDQIFLRWDKHNAIKERGVIPDEKLSKEKFRRDIMNMLEKEAAKSSDIWRHVGAAVFKDKKMLLVGHNTHLPSEHSPYANGDPRSNFSRGVHMDLSSALHAEAGLIAEAARRGISLEGADMYVTVFPCPPCAKLIAHSGIKKLYCGGGNAILDAETVLKSKKVRIYFVV